MSGKLMLTALAVSAMAVGCGGNGRDLTGREAPGGSPGTTGTSGSASATMTLTGCVQAGDPAGSYVLIPTRGGDRAGTSGTGETGTGGSESRESGRDQSTTGAPYRLIPTGNVDFGEQVGKEVTVTGEIARSDEGDDARTGMSGQAGTDERNRQQRGTNTGNTAGSQGYGAGVDESARFFRVTQLTKVAERCPAGGR